MTNADAIEKIFKAIVLPIIPTASLKDAKERMSEMETYPSFYIFVNNRDKLVSKISKLNDLLAILGKSRHHKATSLWIETWFNRMQFIDTSEIHSIPEEIKDITRIVHKIMLLYSINNRGVIVHGSFATHLLDNRIRYADMDVTCLKDDLIFLTSLLLYIFLGVKTHILSIPFIINHRQLRVDADTTSISDALRIDDLTSELSHAQPIKLSRDVLINTQHPVTQFLNYFKMLHLSDRRRKIRHYKENQKLILNAIYHDCLQQLNLSDESLLKVIPYNIEIDASVDRIIRMRLTYIDLQFNIIFHCGYQDVEFMPALRSMLGVRGEQREVLIFHQLCSLFPEQCVEVIDSKESVLHINMSRNEVYKIMTPTELISGEIESIRIDSYSVLNMLAIIGLHYFFTSRPAKRAIQPHVRIISTIIHFCNTMTETPSQMLYNRTKNVGPHIIRNIYAQNTYIKSLKNTYPITVYELPANGTEMKVKESCSIEDYHQRYR